MPLPRPSVLALLPIASALVVVTLFLVLYELLGMRSTTAMPPPDEPSVLIER
jgi:hypothetical protein